MDTPLLLTLFGAAFLSAAVPGPGLLLVATRAATCGRAAGLRVTAGMLVAKVALLGLAWVFLQGLVATDPGLLHKLRLGGAALLVVLGVQMLSGRGLPPAGRPNVLAGDLPVGFALGFTNPAGYVFALAVLPHFLASGTAGPGGMLTVAIIIVVATGLPLAAAALVAGNRLPRPAAGPMLARAGGAALLMIAAFVLAAPVGVQDGAWP